MTSSRPHKAERYRGYYMPVRGFPLDLSVSLHYLSRESVSQSIKLLALNCPLSTVLTVKFFLQVILSFHRFKKVCFLSENGLSGLGAYYMYMYIIEKRTRINYTENVSSRIFIYSFLKTNHNLSVKTQFLCCVYYFLDVILYRFVASKRIVFPLKMAYKAHEVK